MIRPATEQDTAAIRAIWNALITDTTVTFNPVPKTSAEVSAFIQETPVFVAQTDKVVGYASYGAFRPGNGYGRTAEHSIVLTECAQGQGLGRSLIDTVVDHAKARNINSLIAGISAENQKGRDFHAHLGFVQVGFIPQAGHKFGRFIDLVLMQKHL